jgi:hypothetical protein
MPESIFIFFGSGMIYIYLMTESVCSMIVLCVITQSSYSTITIKVLRVRKEEFLKIWRIATVLSGHTAKIRLCTVSPFVTAVVYEQ